VALALDFPSASALRNQLQRYTGLAPHAFRANGGVRPLLASMKQRHAAGRWRARDAV
jgi:hypothetical protein